MNNGSQKPENANQAQASAEQASAEVRSEGEANAPTEVGTNREAEAQMLSQALAVRIAKFYALEHRARLRLEVLAKLTEAEKEALGLK